MSTPTKGLTPSSSESIPTKNVKVNDPSELPSQCSSTPGGTLYSTTPGGTRIVYEKAFMMELRDSPFSRTPPTCEIPIEILRGATDKKKNAPSPKKLSPKASSSAASAERIEEEDVTEESMDNKTNSCSPKKTLPKTSPPAENATRTEEEDLVKGATDDKKTKIASPKKSSPTEEEDQFVMDM